MKISTQKILSEKKQEIQKLKKNYSDFFSKKSHFERYESDLEKLEYFVNSMNIREVDLVSEDDFLEKIYSYKDIDLNLLFVKLTIYNSRNWILCIKTV